MFGVDISVGGFLAIVGVEMVIGFLIGFIILSVAFKWALISAVAIGVFSYFGFVKFQFEDFGQAIESSGITSLFVFISLPLVIGIIIGFVVRKFF